MAQAYTNSQFIPKAEFSPTSQFKVDGMTSDQFVAAKKGSYDDFWALRQKTINEAFTGSVNLDHTFNMNGIYDAIVGNGNYNPEAIKSFSNSIDLWKQFEQGISSNKGVNVIGFDIETIGDINDPSITELAYSISKYAKDDVISETSYTLPIMLDQNGISEATRVINAFEQGGWGSLSAQDQVIAKRLSMYGTAESVWNDDLLGGAWQLTNMQEGTINLERMKGGFAYLTGKKGGINELGIIENYANELISLEHGKNNIVLAANARFDKNAISRRLIDLGFADQAAQIRGMNYIDIIDTAEAVAQTSGITATEYLSSMNGARAIGKSVDAQMLATGVAGQHLHIGGTDALDEVRVGRASIDHVLKAVDNFEVGVDNYGNDYIKVNPIINKFENTALDEEIRDVGATYITNATPDSVFYFNTGKLDRSRGLDFGVINGEVVPNIGITAEYWKLDPTRSGIAEDGSVRYTFSSYADMLNGAENPNMFSIVKNSQEEMNAFINANAIVTGSVDEELARNASQIKYMDYGRREFSKLFDPNAVTYSNQGLREGIHDSYLTGFDNLKQYLSLADELGLSADDVRPDNDSVRLIMKRIAEYNEAYAGEGKSIKMTPYQIQAYTGMFQTLQNEEELLTNIVEQIDKSTDGTNFDKTLRLKNAYRSATEAIGIDDASVAGTYIRNLSDEHAIDVMLGDGTLHRINTSTPKTKASSINRIISSMTTSDVTDVEGLESLLEQFGTNKMISWDTYHNAMNTLGNGMTTPASRWEIAQMISNDLETGIDSAGRSIAEELSATLRKTSGGELLKDVYSQADVFERTNKAIAESIAKTPYAVYAGKDMQSHMADLARQLNYGTILNGVDNANNMVNDVNRRTVESLQGLFGSKYLGGASFDKESPVFSMLITPDKDTTNSAFVLMTTGNKYKQLQDKIAEGVFDFSSRKNLKASLENINDYAAVMEIPYINVTNLPSSANMRIKAGNNILGLGSIRTVSRGEGAEVFLLPQLATYVDKKGQLRAYMNSPEYALASAYQKKMGFALENIRKGDFRDATRLLEQAKNGVLENMPSSASYMTLMGDDGIVRRTMQNTQSDMLNAYKILVKGGVGEEASGLYGIFTNILQQSDMNYADAFTAEGFNPMLNDTQKIGFALAKIFDKDGSMADRTGEASNIFKRFSYDTEVREFFEKSIFDMNPRTLLENEMTVYRQQHHPNEVEYVEKMIQGLKGNGTLFDIINEDVHNLVEEGKMHQSVADALDQFVTGIGGIQNIHSITGERGQMQGAIFAGHNIGSASVHASENNVLRPQFVQAMTSVPFMPGQIGSDITGVMDIGDITRMVAADKMAYGNPERQFNFVSAMKNMSNWDLQMRYKEMGENIGELAQKMGVSEETATIIHQYMMGQYSSLSEDKMFMRPSLSNTELFAQRQARGFSMSMKDIDVDATMEILNQLAETGEVIDRGTVIGMKTNGTAIFSNNTDIVLNEQNVAELLPDYITQENVADYIENIGKTKAVVAKFGDTPDTKVLLGGVEKSMAHSISTTSFRDYMGKNNVQMDLDTAKRIADTWFTEANGDVAFVANLSLVKHGNQPKVQTMWYTMLNEYAQNGRLQDFIDIANYERQSVAFKNSRIGEFSLNGTRVVTDWEDSSQKIEFIQRMLQRTSEDESIGQNIVNRLKYYDENDIALMSAQRQNVNEIMGEYLVFDQRQKQATILRNVNAENGFGDLNPRIKAIIEDVDSAYGRDKYEKSIINVSRYLDKDIRLKASERISRSRYEKGVKKAVQGISLVSEFLDDPAKFIDDSRVATIDIQDLMSTARRPSSGATVEELENSMFFINGRPSKFLQEHARGADIENAIALRIALGNKISVNGVDTESILIPIENIADSGAIHKKFFGRQAGYNASLINRVTNILNDPAHLKDGISVTGALSNAYSDYSDKLLRQMQYFDKTSDLRKFSETVLPNSGYMLGQDQGSMITEGMLNDETLIGIMKQRKLAQRKISSGLSTPDEVRQAAQLYDDATRQLKEHIEKNYADPAKAGKLFDELASNKYNALKHSFIEETVNGESKRYFAPVAALSEESFERMGFDFRKLGFQYYEQIKGNEEYKPLLNELRENINSLDVYGLNVKDGEDIGETIDQWYKKTYGRLNEEKWLQDIDNLEKRVSAHASQWAGVNPDKVPTSELQDYLKWLDKQKALEDKLKMLKTDPSAKYFKIDTEMLNKSIAEGKGSDIARVLNPFADLGKSYMEDVGAVGIYNRSPDFRSYPLTKYVLDRNMEGSQMRLSFGIFSTESNLDFDGDIVAAALLLRNGSLDLDKQKLLQEEFEQTTKSISPNIVADLIASIDDFNAESVSSLNEQRVGLIKKIGSNFETAYEETLAETAQAFMLGDTEMTEGLKKALINTEMFGTALSERLQKLGGLNSVYNKEFIAATLGVEIRKTDIGFVSTPALKLRDNLIRAYNDKNISQEQRTMILSTIDDMTNMRDKFGGFLSGSEQNAIDTKSVGEALVISKISGFRKGLEKLQASPEGVRNIDKFHSNNRFMGSYQIFNSIGTKVFKESNPEQYRAYAHAVNTLSWSQFNKEVEQFDQFFANNPDAAEYIMKVKGKEFAFGKGDRDLLTTMRGMRGVSEIAESNKAFHMFKEFQKHSSADSISKGYRELRNYSIDELQELAKYTGAEDIIGLLRSFENTESFVPQEGMMYFRAGRGGLSNISNDTAWAYIGGQYRTYDLKTGAIGFLDENISGLKFDTKYSGEVSLSQFQANKTLRKDIRKSLNEARIEDFLNEAFASNRAKPENAQINAKYFLDFKKYNGTDSLGNKIYIDRSPEWLKDKDFVASRLYAGISLSKNKNQPGFITDAYKENLERITRIRNAYDLAVADDALMEKASGVGEDLIRSINRQIAQNPQAYKKNGVSYADTVLEEAKRHMRGGLDFDNYLKSAEALGSFNMSMLNERIDIMRNNLFDISYNEQALSKAFSDLSENLDAFRKVGINTPEVLAGLSIADATMDIATKGFDHLQRMSNSAKDITDMAMHQTAISNRVTGFEGSLLAMNMFDKNNYAKQMENVFQWSSKENAQVGFGEYLGQKISDLSASDINTLKASYNAWLNDSSLAKDIGEREKYVIASTLKQLEGVEGLAKQKIRFNENTSVPVGNAIENIIINSGRTGSAVDEISAIIDKSGKADDIAKSVVNTAKGESADATEEVTRRTLKDAGAEFLSSLDNNKKALGIGAGVLAGIGLLGGLAHGGSRRTMSPLEPKQMSSGRTKPARNNGDIMHEGLSGDAGNIPEATPSPQAPPSNTGMKRIYMDAPSGLQFKVSAKTKRKFNNNNIANQIAAVNGGNVRVNTRSDDSKVTDNWLANKFAQMTM